MGKTRFNPSTQHPKPQTTVSNKPKHTDPPQKDRPPSTENPGINACEKCRLEVAPAFEGAGHCDFVGVVDVAAGGDACGNPSDLD